MKKQSETPKLYRTLKGFNSESGERFEIGAVVSAQDLTAADINELIAAGAIEEYSEESQKG